MFCPECGMPIKDHAQFCGVCGRYIDTGVKYCSVCGFQTPAHSTYCLGCGIKLGKKTKKGKRETEGAIAYPVSAHTQKAVYDVLGAYNKTFLSPSYNESQRLLGRGDEACSDYGSYSDYPDDGYGYQGLYPDSADQNAWADPYQGAYPFMPLPYPAYDPYAYSCGCSCSSGEEQDSAKANVKTDIAENEAVSAFAAQFKASSISPDILKSRGMYIPCRERAIKELIARREADDKAAKIERRIQKKNEKKAVKAKKKARKEAVKNAVYNEII